MATKKQASATAPWTWRSSVVVLGAVFVAVFVGAFFTVFIPDGGVFTDDRARFLLRKDNAAALSKAADLADGSDVNLNGVGALARVLLWLEHGADDATRATAEQLLQKATPQTRVSPEALYARALLASLPRDRVPLVDGRIDDELNTAKGNAWVLLGRSVRARTADDRKALLESAAFGVDAPAHATHLLARSLLLQGDVRGARAALDRLFRLDPGHAAGAVTAVVAALIEGSTSAEPKKPRDKNEGPPRPGQGADVVSHDEARAKDLVDSGLDDADEDQLALLLYALELARHGTAPAEVVERAREAGKRSRQNTERLVEIHLCEGDVDAADADLAAVKAVDTVSLLVDVSRKRVLKAVADDERRALQKRSSEVSASGLKLPLCSFEFAFGHVADEGHDVVELGLPWRVMPDGEVFPEKRYRQLTAALARNNELKPDAKLDARLNVVEKLGLAERAVARGDYGSALTLVQQVRDLPTGSTDMERAEAALVDATVRLRQNDLAGVKAAVDVAVSAAPGDPRVLLQVARLQADSDNLIGAKKALAAWKKLGFRSASALIIESIVEAKSGDGVAARADLAEAKKMIEAADDDVLLLRATVLANRAADVGEARRSADRLLALGDAGGGDVVAVWLAEAALRKGEMSKAEAQLKAIVDARPSLAEAHLFYAGSIQFNPAKTKEAYIHALIALDKLPAGPLVEEAKKLALALKRKR